MSCASTSQTVYPFAQAARQEPADSARLGVQISIRSGTTGPPLASSPRWLARRLVALTTITSDETARQCKRCVDDGFVAFLGT